MAGTGAAESAVQVSIQHAAKALRKARGLLVTAGAGIGVDSGLPDFRGVEGLWRHYPPLRNKGLGFSDMANPHWFHSDPKFAWGFYGHRLNLYRRTVPHEGFAHLLKWGERCEKGVHVFTSNVDGQFQRSGFQEGVVCECHGSIHWLQTLEGSTVWPADGVMIPEVDAKVLSVPDESLPRCPTSGDLARPNILMFGDGFWNGDRTSDQHRNLDLWLNTLPFEDLVIIELGAGLAVPTVRMFGERLAARGATLVRINPRDCEGGRGQQKGSVLSIPLGGKEALLRIDAEI